MLIHGSASTPARTRQALRLRDGRRLGYAEWGDPSGVPVCLFSGATNGRLIRHPDDTIVESLGIRLLTFDRPGMGLSSFQPRRRLLDWPNDVVQVLDHVGIERCAIVGGSLGGPYAAACAYALGARLTSVTLVSAVAPVDAPGLWASLPWSIKAQVVLAGYSPRVLGALYSLARPMLRRNPQQALRPMAAALPPSDRAILEQPGAIELLAADILEATRGGGYGAAYDMRVASSAWGFDVAEIRVPVGVWQGTADPNVPLEMARYFVERIPGCRSTFVPDAGHLLIFSAWRAIMEQARSGPIPPAQHNQYSSW